MVDLLLVRLGVILFVMSLVYNVSGVILNTLNQWFVFPAADGNITFFDRIVFTLITVAVFDFIAFFTHYLHHKVPFLWELHKVHHSAEVLTPATAKRFHPIENLLSISAIVLLQSIAVGLFTAFHGTTLDPISVLNVSIIQFFFYLSANVRHSHIWIGFGPSVSHVLVSPCMHQIHHSKARIHADKNFGLIFALWDKCAGTLYVPDKPEHLNFGLSGSKANEFHTLRQLLISPLVNSARRLWSIFSR